LGAVITVLALALDPFAQQLVQYDQHLSNNTDTQTTIALAKRYSKGRALDVSVEADVMTTADFSMQSAILYGVIQPYATVVQQTSFACASGNCTWSPFDSLAICSVCNDLTDQLTSYSAPNFLYISLATILNVVGSVTTNSTTFRLPNGLFINNYDGMAYNAKPNDTSENYGSVYMTTFGTGNVSKTNTLENNDSLIWAMSVLRLLAPSNASIVWPNIPIEAIECGLFYCVKQYESTVQNGILHEIETDVSNATRNPNSWQPILYDGLPYDGIILNDSTLQSLEFNKVISADQRTDLMFGEEFNVSQAAVDSISNYFQNQFSNSPDLNYTNDDYEPEDTNPNPVTVNGFYTTTSSNVNDNASYFSPSVIEVLFESSNINDTFRSLARSMSNAIRAGADNGAFHTGEKGVMTTYYRIEWPWIALYAVLVIAGIVFLAITIFETKHRSVPAWKSSSLAPLSCAAEIGNVLVGVESVEVMEERASKYLVRLFGDQKYQRVGGEDGDLVQGGEHRHVRSSKKVQPLSLVKPSSGLPMTGASLHVADVRDKTIRRKPVARESL
jgi:hypothetical protein